MHEYLRKLGPDARVLDLGCQHGSFAVSATQARVVRVDLSHSDVVAGNFVCSDAAALPFSGGCFDLIVANHSLEHFPDLDGVLREMAVVVKPGGALFVSVPDASTLTDIVYRWLGDGGGHVNPFTDATHLSDRISSATGLPLRSTRVLHSGLSFLNRKNCSRMPRRTLLIGGGYEFTLQIATYLFRWSDRLLGTRLSVYGWAFCFGPEVAGEETPQANVCVRCGSGHSAAWLVESGLVRRFLLWRRYRCPGCSTWNLFTREVR